MTGPPQAPRRPYEHTEHGVRRSDPYSWLRQVDDPDVLGHLTAERAWYDAATGHLASLVETLRGEMVARVPAEETSPRWRHRDFSYYTRLPGGREYRQLLRDFNSEVDDTPLIPDERPPQLDGFAREPQLLLDANLLADGSAYLELGLALVSPDDRLLAYSVDLVGDEVYRLRFRDLETGEDLPEEISHTYYGGGWSADSEWFFYTVHDALYRPFQVWRHRVGTPASQDVLMLEEPDPQFDLNVRATRSGGLLVLWSASRDTTEVWVVDTADPSSPPRSVGGRRRGVEYHAEHLVRPDGTDTLLLVTNDGAQEFRLMAAPAPRAADQDHTVWRGLLPEHPAERLERVDAFAGHVVLSLRTDGEHRLRVVPLDAVGRGAAEGGVSRPTRPAGFEARPPVVEPASGARRVETTFDIRPAFPAGSVALGVNQEYDATAVTVADQSYVHPPVWSDVDLTTGQRTERHRREAPGHDPSTYVCGIRTFPAPDGTQVPATLVRHRDTPLDGTAPALLYGYGAYEDASDPEWDPALPSLLDRGVVFVHTHVRGGGEGGRQWWLDGRLDRKQNTFTDHVAVADGLAGASMAEPIAHGDRVETPALVDGTRLATRGLSAGGLVQAAVFTQRPERWRAVVAEVPFVDVVTTMFDPSVPLTAAEWDEWGDPRRKADFDWLLAYSPYDNLPPAGGRPDLLVTGALHDPRVMVWEPAKWVAALRHSDPQWSPRCLFRCEIGAGAHAGPAGRFAHLAYEAEVYAWVLDQLQGGLG